MLRVESYLRTKLPKDRAFYPEQLLSVGWQHMHTSSPLPGPFCAQEALSSVEVLTTPAESYTGQAATGCGRLEQAGTGWDRLGHAGTGCGDPGRKPVDSRRATGEPQPQLIPE